MKMEKGYRQLKVGEKIQDGDEFFNSKYKIWKKSKWSGITINELSSTYRRKIEEYRFLKSDEFIKSDDEYYSPTTESWSKIPRSDIGLRANHDSYQYRRKIDPGKGKIDFVDSLIQESIKTKQDHHEELQKEIKKIKSWCHFFKFEPELQDIENLKYLKSFLRIKKLIINYPTTKIYLINGQEGCVKWKDGDTWSLKEGILLAFAKAMRDIPDNFNNQLGYYPLTAKIDTEAYIPASYKWVNHHLDTRCSNKHLFPNFEEKDIMVKNLEKCLNMNYMRL
jgi:hypothetical protein